VLGEWPVETQAEGEEQIVELIREAIADEDDDEDDD
jgi:predicted TIM-barrel fold metal-dependent hydrolase